MHEKIWKAKSVLDWKLQQKLSLQTSFPSTRGSRLGSWSEAPRCVDVSSFSWCRSLGGAAVEVSLIRKWMQLTTSKIITNANAHRTHMKISYVDSKRMHTPIKSNKIIPNDQMHVNICQHFYLQKSSRPTPLFASFHSCLGILVTGHDPQPSSIQPGLSLFICSVRPCCLGSETAAVSAAFESTLMVSTPWKIANYGSSFLRGVKNKQFSSIFKPPIVCIWWKVPRYCMQGVQRGVHFTPLLPNPGRIFLCFTSVHQPSNSMQFYPHKPIQVLTGSSMRDNGIFFTSSGNSPPTGHHLDTVWALLKIFEDISMFKFVELVFNVV